jgi:hypothetical protein
MATHSVETENNSPYQDIFSETDPAIVDRDRTQATFLGFYEHLRRLAAVQHRVPNLVEGSTLISLPAYYKLPGHGENPINSAALGLLPAYDCSDLQSNAKRLSVRTNVLDAAMLLPHDGVAAARAGHAATYMVADALRLLAPEVWHAYRAVEYVDYSAPNHRRARRLHAIVQPVARDLNEAAVGDIKDVVALVRSKGYQDFFDYLIDAHSIIKERVDTIFPMPSIAHLVDAPVESWRLSE